MDIPHNATVIGIRFVVHTMGLAGWDKSRNHWSIFLILEGGTSSVRLNMSLRDGGDENGTFTPTSHDFVLSASNLTYFDYKVWAGLRVSHCLNLIYTKGRHNYRMTASGNGCRYWVWTVFSDLVDARYIPITSSERQEFGTKIQLRYHKSAQTQQVITLPDPMETGEFF